MVREYLSQSNSVLLFFFPPPFKFLGSYLFYRSAQEDALMSFDLVNVAKPSPINYVCKCQHEEKNQNTPTFCLYCVYTDGGMKAHGFRPCRDAISFCEMINFTHTGHPEKQQHFTHKGHLSAACTVRQEVSGGLTGAKYNSNPSYHLNVPPSPPSEKRKKTVQCAERGVPCGGRYNVSHTVCVCISRMEP